MEWCVYGVWGKLSLHWVHLDEVTVYTNFRVFYENDAYLRGRVMFVLGWDTQRRNHIECMKMAENYY